MDEGVVNAVDGISFDVMPGQVLGIVGESGCGKSVTMKAILQSSSGPGRITSRRDPLPPATTAARQSTSPGWPPHGPEMRAIRGARDRAHPAGADGRLQPGAHGRRPDHRGDPAARPSLAGRRPQARRAEARDITVGLFRDVGISMPEQRLDAYSWQLTGGLRQRAMIAMALSCKPRLLIADEPTTAIDVTTQAQVLALLRDLQAEHNTAIIFITHDLGVIAQMASYVMVMYLGLVMEQGPVDEIFHAPKHPYTQALLRSIPSLYGAARASPCRRSAARCPHPFNRPPGCPFHPRCPDVMERCSIAVPSLQAGGGQPAGELLPASRARRSRHDPSTPTRCSTSAACGSSSPSPRASCSAPSATCAPSTTSTSPSTRARRSAWSARAAAARPPPRAASCAPSTRPAARSCSAPAQAAVVDLATLPPAELRPLRAEMQMIFQDPYGSLNPRMTLLDNVGEPLLVNGMKNRKRAHRPGGRAAAPGRACGPSSCSASRMPSAAASASASASPARWRPTRAWSWPTSRSRRSTSRCRRRC